MAQTNFTLDIIIQTPLQTLLDFHSNLHNHTQIHPLIQSIELVEEHINTQQQLVSHFKIQDKLYLLGFIPYRFYYKAIRTQISPTQFQFEVASSMNVRMQTVVEYIRLDTNTSQLKETVYIEAPKLLLNYTKQTAQKAHLASFQKMKILLE